ncbi:MAG: methyltransferase domain-containing protein [Bryobacterales bacterium]|nr:methyltransferase domain-containing protein [Bryobacterales bacterium]
MSQYIHGTHDEEHARLGLLNAMLNRKSLTAVAPRPGDRMLDAGCGAGQFTQAMAEAAGPGGFALGVERSEEQLTRARALTPALAEFRQGDIAASPLPLRGDEWGSFDIVHARFLLEHLADPLAAVQQLVRAAKPGSGRIILEDDDHAILRVEPEPPGFSSLWTAYQRAFDRLGNDPSIGRRLVTLLHQAGARPARATLLCWSGCAGDAEFAALTRNLIEVIGTARTTVVAQGLLSAPRFDAAIAALWAWSREPDAVLWYAISCVEALAPPAG